MRLGKIQLGAVALVASAVLLLGACGSDTKEDTTSTTDASSDTTVTTTSSTAQTVAFDKSIQAELKTVGCYTGAVDGVIGAETDAAILAFQNAEGLEADGELGPETDTALKAAVAAGKKVCSASSGTTVASTTTTTAASGTAPCTAAAVSVAVPTNNTLQSYVCSEGYAGITFTGPDENLGAYVLKANGTTWVVDTNACGGASAGIDPAILEKGCTPNN